MVLGDSASDTLEFHDRCVDRQDLPACTFNPRNTADPLDTVFRLEASSDILFSVNDPYHRFRS